MIHLTKFHSRLFFLLSFCAVYFFNLEKINAQSSANYAFSTSNTGSLTFDINNNFLDMTTGTSQLIGPGLDSVLSPLSNIGFDFYFMGTYFNSFSCTENGMIELGAHTLDGGNYIPSSNITPNLLAPFAQNLQTGTDGEVRYKLFGTAPDRVLVIEFINTIISSLGANAATAGTATFQARLYETTGVFEFIYGQMATNNSLLNYSPVEIGWLSSTAPDKFMSVDSLYNENTNGAWAQFITLPNSIVSHLHSSSEGNRRSFVFTPPQTSVVSPASLHFSYVNPSSVTISWTDSSTNETSFNVFRSTDNIFFTRINTTTSSSTATEGTGYSFVATGLSPNTTYYFRVVANSEAIPSLPLSGSQLTGIAKAYHWTGSGTTFFSDPLNWNPLRISPDPTDTLYFDNGSVSMPGYISSQSVAKIEVSHNTTVYLQSYGGATITIAGKTANVLNIASGSALYNIAPFLSSISIQFSPGSGATANIAGTFEQALGNTYSATNAITTVSGRFNNSGTLSGTTAGNFIVTGTGTYNHIFSSSTVIFPTANWSSGSTCLFTGVPLNNFNFTGFSGQTFSNITWSCSSQSANVNLGGFLPNAVNGTFTMTDGSLKLATNTSPTLIINNFIQTGGIFDLNNGAGKTLMKISGSFIQSGGSFASLITGIPTLEFNGTSGIQSVSFNNSAPTGAIIYKISNPSGISLTGSGALTTNFSINNNGGIDISTTAAIPIHTTLNIVYNNTGTILTYEAPSNRSMTAKEYPPSSGPFNVTVNMPGLVLTMPFSRTIRGILTMTGGDIDVGPDSITIGVSAGSPGTLSWYSGNIRVTTGSMTRWFGTFGLSAIPDVQVGYFPLANGNDNRNVYVYGSVQLLTGGSLTITHTNIPGITTGLSVVDGSYIIQRRTNSFWTFSSSGITSNSSTLGIRITGANLITTASPVKLRLMQASSISGTNVFGSGLAPNFMAERAGLNSSNLSTDFYIGAADADMEPFYVATTTGNWSDPAIWSSGIVPGISDNATIAPGVTVSLDGINQCKSLTINPGGTLNAFSNSLIADVSITTNGSLNIAGGSVTINGGTIPQQGLTTNNGSNFDISSGSLTIGPAGGGNKRWTHAGGNANITGGTININGNILITGGNFTQSNGNIIIDGNSGLSASTSVLNGSSLFQLTGGTLACSGGTITIVDPPYVTATKSNAVSIKSAVTSTTAFTGTHAFIFGNGSTTTGNPVNGFSIETYSSATGGRIPLNNVIVNAGNATGRFVRNTLASTGGTHINGTLTIYSNSEYRVVTNTVSHDCFGGNIINNGTFTAGATITLGGENGVYTINTPQTISGTGVFRNLTSGATANFSGITLNNSSGVMVSTGNLSYSGVFTFLSGNINMGPNTLIQVTGGSTAGSMGLNNHIIGSFQQHASTGSMLLVYPVGDLSSYFPVTIIGTAGSVLTSGDILVSTTPSEHPLILSSGIVSTKDVNRYYSIQGLNGITFSPLSVSIIVNWLTGDVDANANINNFIVGKYDNPSWTFPQVRNKASTSIRIIELSDLSDFVVGEPCTGVADFSYLNSTYCNTGTASPSFTNGGTAGTFSEPSGLLSLSPSTGTVNLAASLPGTYIVTNTLTTSGCSPVSDTALIIVTGTSPASVSITATANPSCTGAPVTFTATPVNGGLANYQWKLNGVNAGTNSPVFTDSVLSNGNTVKCIMTSGLSCATGSPATSNIISMTVNPNPVAPVISATGPTIISCSGSVSLFSNYHTSGNQWNPGGAVTDTITTTSGSYTVTFTDANGCISPPSAPKVVTLLSPTSPLSGNYTVGSGPASCSNFISLESALDALNTRGVSGNVIFNIPAGYTETAPNSGLQVKMNSLPVNIQSSSTRNVTFRKNGTGADPLITAGTGSSNLDAIIKIVGADYIIFDGIDVTDTIANTNPTTQMEWGYALLKSDGSNGAQHNTIKNCNITLQKTNTSSIGIYLNNHTETSNIALAYSGNASADSAFRSSYNLFTGNNISGVYTGISLGGSLFFNDSLNEIGNNSATANTITDFGGGGIPVSGIIVSNQQRIKINNNSIVGGDGTTSTTTGINVVASTGFSGDVSNNSITLNSASASINGISGINIPSITNGDNLNILGNMIHDCSFSIGTTASFSGIVSSFTGTGTENANNNFISNNNLTTPTTGTFTGILISATPGTLNVNNNSIMNNNLSGTGLFNGINISSGTNIFAANANSISGNQKTGTGGTMNCIIINSSANHILSGNSIVNNGLISSSGAVGSNVFGITNQSGAGTENVTGNIIRKLFISGTNSGTNTISGIRYNDTGTNRIINNNKIDSLYSSASTAISGISSLQAAGTVTISGNKIFDLVSGGTGANISGIVTGSSSSSIAINNNYIGRLFSPFANGSNAVKGMDLNGTTNIGVYYNTIRLSASSNSNFFGTSGIFANTLTNVDMRNNIIVNLSVPGGLSGNDGVTAAYRRSSGVLSSYAITSDHNLFYADSAGPNNLIYCEGIANPVVNPAQTLTDYTALIGILPRDAHSVTENVHFLSTTGSDSTYLHINPAILTYVEGNATPVAGINFDYDGDLRNTIYPDIGADESGFTGVKPSISSAIPSPGSGQCTAVSHIITAIVIPGLNPVTSVNLNYSFDGIAQNPVSMTNSSGNNWDGIIPAASPPNAVVTWTVIATDGNFSQSTSGSYQDEILSLYNLAIDANATPASVCGSGMSQLNSNVRGTGIPLNTYCSPANTGSSNCIYDVELNSLSNNSSSQGGCALPAFTVYPQNGSTTTTLTAGNTYPLTVTCAVNSMVWVWIDYNRNGTFESSEGTLIFPAAITGTVNITIPPGASIGGTRMRLRSTISFGAMQNTDACLAESTGETEDYIINIIPPFTYSWNPSAGLSNPTISNPVATVSSSSVYTVSAHDAHGCTLPSISTTTGISITSPPPAPSGINSTQCGSGIPACSVNSSNSVYYWYLSTSDSASLPGENGSFLSSYQINATTHFWVSAFDGTCESGRTEVIAFVNQPDTINAFSNTSVSCVFDTITLSATHTGTNNTYTYAWTAFPSAGSGINGSLNGQTAPVSPTLAGTYLYTVTGTDVNFNCHAVATVSVTAIDLPVISAVTSSSSNGVCPAGNDTLNAYTTLTGTGIAGKDSLRNSKTDGWPTPYGGYFGGARSQYLITANELTAAGLNAGPITSLGFSVAQLSSVTTYTGFSISIGNTSVTTLSNNFETSPVTNVYGPVNYTPFSGINTHVFTTPFTWNGVSNLLINICFNNNSAGNISGNVVCNSSNTSYISSIHYGANLSSAVCFSAASGGQETRRPNLIFGGNVFSTGNGLLNWSWMPGSIIGNSLVVSPAVTAVYTITATDNITSCSNSSMITVNVFSVPAAVVAYDSSQCGYGIPVCSVSGTGNLYHWYLTPSGGTFIPGETGASLTTYRIASTTDFYVAEFDGTCDGQRTIVHETVIHPDSVNASASSDSSCLGSPVTLSVQNTGTSNSYTYSWIPDSSGAGGITIPLTGQNISVIPTATGTYIYTVVATDGNCATLSSATVTVYDNPVIVSTSAQPFYVCSGDSVTLSAKSFIVTSPVAIIGQGTILNTGSTYPTPFGHSFGGSKEQYLINASELIASGLQPGNLTSLAFDISAIPSSGGNVMKNFSISMGITNLTSLPATIQTGINGMTQLVFISSDTISTGINTYNFTSSFNWNGYSNLLVEVCFNNNDNGGGNGGNAVVKQSATAYVSTIDYQRSNDATVCSNAGTSTINSFTQRPNFIIGGTVGADLSSTLSWKWNPGNLDGYNVSTVDTNAGPKTYTVTATNVHGCTSTMDANFYVTPLSPPPVPLNATHCGNKVPLCSVTGSGGTFRWYLTSIGGTALPGEENSLLTSFTAGVTTTFYVAEFDGNCETQRVPVVETVTPTDSVNIILSDIIVCKGKTVLLTAVQNGNTNNYSYSWATTPGGGLNSFNGSQVTATPSVAGFLTYTITATDSGSGCTWISEKNIISKLTPVVYVTPASDSICPGSSEKISAVVNLSGNAIQLNGIDQYVSIPSSAGLNLATNFTLEAWINPGYFSDGEGIISKNQSSVGSYFLRLGSVTPFNTIAAGGSSATVAPLGILNSNTWYHVAAVFTNLSGNNNNVSIYINGSLIFTGTANVLLNSDPLQIGVEYGGKYFNGIMDEIRIWNTALSPVILQSWKNKPLNNSHPAWSNLIAYYDCDFPIGDTIIDLSGNGNNGILMNGISVIPSTAPLDNGFSYSWTPVNSVGNPYIPDPVVTPSSPGNNLFVVTATASNGCANDGSSTIVADTTHQSPFISSPFLPSGFCNSGSGIITLQNARPGSSIQWQSSPDNLIWTNISNANDVFYFTGNVTTTTYFRVVVSCSGTDSSNVVLFNIDSPSVISTSGASRCGTGQVSISVTGNGTFDWYQNSTLGTSLFTGPVFQPVVSTSTTYWVEAHIGTCLFPGNRKPVIVNITPPPALNVAASSTTICDGSGVILNVNSSNDPNFSYVWTPGNLHGTGISVSPSLTTIFTVTATDTTSGINNSCVASSSITVNVNPLPPVPLISPASPSICTSGSSVTLNVTNVATATFYKWNPGNHSGTSFTVSPPVTTTYILTATKSTGCINYNSVTVYNTPAAIPVITASGSTTICQGENITLMVDTGYTSYNWSDGSNNIGISQTINVSPAATTTYTITAWNGACDASASQAVSVLPFTPLNITTPGNSTSFCLGSNLNLDAGSGYTVYSWSYGTGVVGTSRIYPSTIPGTYYVTVTSANGCSATGNITTSAIPSPAPPVITPPGPVILCDDGSNSPVILTADTTGAGAGSDITWNNIDGTTTTTLPVNFNDLDLVLNNNTFNYFLIATNNLGCSRTSDTVTISVTTCLPGIILNARMFIEGYYANGNNGLMNNYGSGGCLFVNGFSTDTLDADTVYISAMNASNYSTVDTKKGILRTNGHVTVTFDNTVLPGTSYYIKVKHRNAIETWSANPVLMTSVTDYDFTTSQSKAYGNNMIRTRDSLYWAFYSGDFSNYITGQIGMQDGLIESEDYSDMENAVYFLLMGYVPEDITGDGIVESMDYSILENNVYNTIISMHP